MSSPELLELAEVSEALDYPELIQVVIYPLVTSRSPRFTPRVNAVSVHDLLVAELAEELQAYVVEVRAADFTRSGTTHFASVSFHGVSHTIERGPFCREELTQLIHHLRRSPQTPQETP